MSGTPQAGLSRDNPWPGLASYTEADRDYFFGRDDEAQDLARRIRRERLTVLFGQSGLGKTSLLQAGVFPRLRAADLQPVYIRLDYRSEEKPLTAQVLARLAEVIAADGLDAPRPVEGESLWGYFHRPNLEWWSPDNHLMTPVLVFDQFEEIFTLGRADRDASQSFLDELADLIENRPPAGTPEPADEPVDEPNSRRPVRILLSFREDFLPDFEGLKGRIHSLFVNRLRLTALTGAAALDILERSGGHLFSPGLAQSVVRFVAADKHGRALDELAVEPALLSVVCRELNERRMAAHADAIGADMLQGGQREILHELIRRAFQDLPTALVEAVEEYLLTDSGHRTQYPLDDLLRRSGVARDVVHTLVQRRIVRVDSRADVDWVELTHDLLAPIVRENRDRRRHAAKLAMLEAKRRRLVRIGGGALAVALAVLAVIFAAYREADAQRAVAEAQRRVAEERTEAAAAAAERARAAMELADERAEAAQLAQSKLVTVMLQPRMAEGTPDQVALVARRVLPADPKKPDRPFWNDAWDLFVTAALRDQARAVLRMPQGQLTAAALSTDGNRIATAGRDGSVTVWDAGTGAPVLSLPGHRGTVAALAFSPDGRRLLSVSLDWTARLWDVADGRVLAVLAGHEGPVLAGAFAPNGRRLATASADGAVRLFDAETGATLAVMKGEGGSIGVLRFAPDGEALLAAAADGTAELWSASEGRRIARLTGHTGAIEAAAFSGDGTRVVTASRDGTARVWDARRGHAERVLTGHVKPVVAVAVDAAGTRVVTASLDHTARLWAIGPGQDGSLVLRGHKDGVLAAAFAPDGASVATGALDGTVRLWDLDAGKGDAVAGRVLGAHRAAVVGLAYDGPGRTLLSAATDGSARVWAVEARLPPAVADPAEFIAAFELRAVRTLTPAEEREFSLDAPEATAGLPATAPAAAVCDALAGDPFDPGRTVRGRPPTAFKVADAEAACRQSAAGNPGEARLAYQLGRALTLAGKTTEAASAYRKAADAGYPAAMRAVAVSGAPGEVNATLLAEAFAKGMPLAGGELATLLWDSGDDRKRAMDLWTKAAAKGDPGSHWQLAERYQRGDEAPKDLRRAALHYALAARFYDEKGEDAAAGRAVERRGTVARALPLEVAAAVWHDARDWKVTP